MSVTLSELTPRFNLSEMKRQNVRRCLFGPPDPEKLSRDFDKREQIFFEEDAKRFREKWNFDPVTGPIEGGKFQYEVIAVDSKCESVPNFYLKGYTSHKSRPARPTRERIFSSVTTDSSRPNSAKRKLDLENHENDENEVFDKRVPSKGDIIIEAQLQHMSTSSCLSDSEEDTSTRCSRLCELPTGLTHLSSSSSLSELSPMSRNKDIMTPTSRPRSMVQSSMKDFLPNKKQRMLNIKALPRT